MPRLQWSVLSRSPSLWAYLQKSAAMVSCKASTTHRAFEKGGLVQTVRQIVKLPSLGRCEQHFIARIAESSPRAV